MICKCGHEESHHKKNKFYPEVEEGECLALRGFKDACTCKKFEARYNQGITKVKPNHSPSEDSDSKQSCSKSSGGDSPLTNPEPDSVSRIDGGDLT